MRPEIRRKRVEATLFVNRNTKVFVRKVRRAKGGLSERRFFELKRLAVICAMHVSAVKTLSDSDRDLQ